MKASEITDKKTSHDHTRKINGEEVSSREELLRLEPFFNL